MHEKFHETVTKLLRAALSALHLVLAFLRKIPEALERAEMERVGLEASLKRTVLTEFFRVT